MRQFVDGFKKYPIRFEFLDPATNDVVHTYDLKFSPGDYTDGTFLNRGYWQPIEDFLGAYNTDDKYELLEMVKGLIDSKFKVINGNVDALNHRISGAEQSLLLYAPKEKPHFINPRAAESPSATDDSDKVATTAQVRAFISQYPFPPKSLQNFRTESGPMSIKLYWKDSPDFAYDGMTLSRWNGTKISIKQTGYPASENDGTVVVDNTLRDLYNTYAFEITDIPAEVPTYIRGFPYSDKGAYNRSGVNMSLSVTPQPRFDILPSFASRSNFRCARLGDRGVLVMGGESRSTGRWVPTNRVELYNTSGEISTFTSLSQAKSEFGAAPTKNGYVIVGGGSNYDSGGTLFRIDRIEMLSPDGINTVFTQLLPYAAAGMSAESIGSNSVLLFGGTGNEWPVKQAVVIASTDGSILRLDDFLVTGLSDYASATTGNDDVIIAGGWDVDGNYQDTVYLYMKDGTRKILEPLTVKRINAGATMMSDGSVIIVGGQTSPSGGTEIIERYTKDGVKTIYSNAPYKRGGHVGATDRNVNAIIVDSLLRDNQDNVMLCTEDGTITTYRIHENGRAIISTDPLGNVFIFTESGLCIRYTVYVE